MPNLKIYSDNAIEAAWFKNLHPRFGDVEEALILSRGQNTPPESNLANWTAIDFANNGGTAFPVWTLP